MNLTQTILRNAFANWVGFAIQVTVTFFLTPFVVHTLGGARYGLWALLMILTGCYGFLDLGFRAGLTQYLSRYLATEEFDKLNQSASTGVVALTLVAGILVVVSLILSWLAPMIFMVPASSEEELRRAIQIVGIGVALQFPFFVYSATFTATQRYDALNAIGVINQLLGAAMIVMALRGGYGLLGISLATLASSLVSYGLTWRWAYRVLPQLTVSLRLANMESCREFLSFGFWNVLINGSRRLINYIDAVVIGLFLPAAAITPYVLAASLAHYLRRLIEPLGKVLFPAATRLDALGDEEGLRTMYLVGSRIFLAGAILAGLIGAFWSDEFFLLWLGEEYSISNEHASVGVLFRILVVATVIYSAQTIGHQVLLGRRLLHRLAPLMAGEAVANLLLSLVMIQFFGLIGVAAGTLVPGVAIQGLALPLMVLLSLSIPAREYCLTVYPRALTTGFLAAAVLAALKATLPAVHSWPGLFLQGLLAGLLSMGLFAFIAITQSERRVYIWQPVGRLLALLRDRGNFENKSSDASSRRLVERKKAAIN